MSRSKHCSTAAKGPRSQPVSEQFPYSSSRDQSGHLFPGVEFKLLIQQRSLKFTVEEQKSGMGCLDLSLLGGLPQT